MRGSLTKIMRLKGIGPTVPMATLWLGSMAALLGGLALDCSEFSATMPGKAVTVTLYFLSVVGWATWLGRRFRETGA